MTNTDKLFPNAFKSSFIFGKEEVTIESGRIATQALSSVWLTMGDCVILACITHNPCIDESRDFLPLSVHYQEKFYSIGEIPGGYLKREGRPSEREVIISRLIDRAIRPMFPKGFKDEVQVVVTLLQKDPEIESDIAAMLATSAALCLSPLPYEPIAAVRVGHIDGQLTLNTSTSNQTRSTD